ncbi:MAG: hypothetical protein HWN69_05065, partial [Desulfobacterales bacterium]|nr:hypothetical protein [Desulfobacterales bacterium]
MDYSSTIAHYDKLLGIRAKDHEMVGWGSEESQKCRFGVLCQLDDLSGKSVLDVGCGLGDLYGYLRNRDII